MPTRRFPISVAGVIAAALVNIPTALAQAPVGYYASVDPSTPATLRQSVHAVIKDHLRFPYTAATTDTWDILELADQDVNNSAHIVDLYKNQSILKQGGGNSFYNREHSWPNSFGFPNDGATNSPYTDCHALFLSDSGYNSSRGNNVYRGCLSGCSEKVTVLTNGQGGGSGLYPGNSNWRAGSGATGSWETWQRRRGDVARALLYLDVRYEGGLSGSGNAEPDLILTDDEALIAASNTGNNEAVAYMGMRSVLLQWHLDDPVDERERGRDNVVFSFQANRNPFIDHPEWVECVFNNACSVGTAFCFGDGLGTGCPCGNNSAVGAQEGCLNSLGTGGKLTAMGRASLTSDTVVLAGTRMPNGGVLYFQGTTQASLAFGDGLLCVTGSVVRLGTRFNVLSASQYPDPVDTRISVQGGVTATGTREYQAWYRDAATFCTPSTFNLTNGWRITWGA